MRKIFLENLPRYKTGGKINWAESIGYEVDFIYEDIKDKVKIIDFDTKSRYLIIKYKDINDFKIYTGNFKKCNLGKILNKITIDFKVEIGQIFKGDKRDLIIIDRKYIKDSKGRNYKNYKYYCNKCEYEGWIAEANLLYHKKGCGCCANKIVIQGINDVATTDQWMTKYFLKQEETKLYTRCSEKKVKVVCPDCGRIKDKKISIKDIYINQSISCTCNDSLSYPNKFAYSLLDQLNYFYSFNYLEHEYSPSWIKPRKYDNYFELNNEKYILEMDGEFHYKNNNMSGQTAEESQVIDDYKDEQAKLHDIEVIRIDCKESNMEYIKQNILQSRLSKLFDLSKVDWLKCEEFALSNLVKQACEYKKNNPELSTTEIGSIMKLHKGTIRTYLKRGNELGWCEYNAQEEQIRNKCKPVEIFKDGISLGIFESIANLEKCSKELFGVQLSNASISAVCLGRQKIYKGYTFVRI